MNGSKRLFLSILTVLFASQAAAITFEEEAVPASSGFLRSLAHLLQKPVEAINRLVDKGVITQEAIDTFNKGLIVYIDPLSTPQLINTLSISLTGAGISFLGTAMIYKALEDYLFDTDTNQPLSTKKYVASGILGCSAVVAGLYTMAYARTMANKITVTQ